MSASLSPYLYIQTFGEAGAAQNDAEKNLTMHAALNGDGITLFASDGRPGQQVSSATTST